MIEFPSGICNDKWRPVPRQPDADIFYIHCTGGFRGAKVNDEHWQIEPVFEGGEARTKGFLSGAQLRKIIRIGGFKELGFQSSGWHNGVWHSTWRPIIPQQRNHSQSPANIWQNISSNLFYEDRASTHRNLEHTNQLKIAEILDDRSVEGRLSLAISLSLRSMDLAVEQIGEHYYEQLVNKMYAGKLEAQRSSNTMDQNLFAHVHAFFLQLGSARDYLAAFVASRLGLETHRGKVDSMNNLRKALRHHHMGHEPILDILVDKHWLIPKKETKDRWEIAGWLKEITDLRNEFVHQRPYGSVYSERFGYAIPLQRELGLYRYYRPIEIKGQPESDLLDVISSHYRTSTGLFFEAANISGLNASILTLTEKDIVSLKITSP